MSLLAYNLTGAPVTLTGVTPAVVLPLSAVAPLPGDAVNVTSELKGLAGATYVLLQTQSIGTVRYVWSTGAAEYTTPGLTVATTTSATATTGAMTLYVATTGNDSNDGLSTGSALLTLQAAIDKVPKIVLHLVTINVAAGTYAAVDISAFSIGTNGLIKLLGVTTAPTLTTGTTSGTATSHTVAGNTLPTMTDSGQSWTVNELRGKFVKIGAATARVIVSNTATTLTLVDNFVAPVDTTYVLLDTASSTPSVFVSINTAPQGSTTRGLVLDTMRLATNSTSVQVLNHRGSVFLTNCSIVSTGASAFSMINAAQGILGINNCVLDYYGNNSAVSTSVLSDEFLMSSSYAVTRTSTNVVFSASASTFLSIFNIVLEKLAATGSEVASFYRGYGTFSATILAPSGATYAGLNIGEESKTLPSGDAAIGVDTLRIANCATGVQVKNAGRFIATSATLVYMSGVTTAFNVSTGGTARIGSATLTLNGASPELTIDGANFTIANLDAASPQILASATIGSRVMRL